MWRAVVVADVQALLSVMDVAQIGFGPLFFDFRLAAGRFLTFPSRFSGALQLSAQVEEPLEVVAQAHQLPFQGSLSLCLSG